MERNHLKTAYIYIYIRYPPKKPMFTSLLLVFAILCVYFWRPFGPWFLVPYKCIYIYTAGRLHNLFVQRLQNSGMLSNFGRNAFRMHSCSKPRSKIPTRLLAKILDWYNDKDVLANPKSKIFHKTSVQILDLGFGKECILWHSLVVTKLVSICLI